MSRLRDTLASAALFFGLSSGSAFAIEEPSFSVVGEYSGWELREYDSFIEAQVTVTGAWDEAVSRGFRLLAGYIFGANRGRESIDMTAPVAATRVQSREIEMTAPVAAQRANVSEDGEEAWTVAFSMPASWSMDTLPIPDDPRVELVEIPAREVAARSFGMWATERRVADETAALVERLDAEGLDVRGEPVIAQYNPPWTPPPLRRNEILVVVSRR